MRTVWNIYSPGELVWVSFGKNVGSELCGPHFAVIVEQNNHPHNDTVMAVPLSSKKVNGKVRYLDVDLGNLIPGTGKVSLAKTSQLTRISKQRILSRSYNGQYLKLNEHQLKEVQRAIKIMLFENEAA